MRRDCMGARRSPDAGGDSLGVEDVAGQVDAHVDEVSDSAFKGSRGVEEIRGAQKT
jgi:hypothetical protein